MANIYDVAKLAGVSRSAVSRVLNNQKGVHPNQRQKVLDAVKELNYRPNSMARGLAMKKTNTIAVIARELADPFYSAFIRSLNYHADINHYGALYCVRNSYLKSNVDYLSSLSAKVDGYIFLGEGTISEKELDFLAETKIPVVAMEFKYNVKDVTYLTINNYEESTKGIEYLIKKGHKNILYICLDENVSEFEERKMGYIEAVKKAELDYCKVIQGTYDMTSNIELGKSLISLIESDQITAISCANDLLAIGINEGIKSSKLKKTIDIVGFDGIYQNEYMALPLTNMTTLKQPQDAMGTYAIESLISLIEGEWKDYSKEFECELVEIL